jgi:lipoprotein-anchoring transpeptidase ErfK/SrfK
MVPLTAACTTAQRWGRTLRVLTAALCIAGLVAAVGIATLPALADPGQVSGDPPPGVDAPSDLAVPTADVPVPPLAYSAGVDAGGSPPPAAAPGPVAGQDPTPFTGEAPFGPPSFDPPGGATVGVAKPIVINFAAPIADRALAQSAVHVSSNPPVPGHFYWMTNSQLRWRPEQFWPAHTTVSIDAGGTKSSFTIGDALVATADSATHQLTITRNGTLVNTFPMSMGKSGDDTPNGTYYVTEKWPMIVMDSSTYGVPVDSAQGYRVKVYDAVRISNTGIFVHAAPWSVSDQGKRNVSHGCINISPTNAKWFIDNVNRGDPVVVKNSVGTYNQNDGTDDWQR